MSQTGGDFWPQVTDFNPMLQNPKMGFHNAELKLCEIERNANKQPRPRSGNFAVCFKGSFATGTNVCVRLFSRKAEERRERYAEISNHLSANPIDCLVKFEYIEKGIRHPDPGRFGNRQWFPIIRMDWIEGSILFDWLRERCRLSDSKAIRNAADQWIEVAQQLESAGIAHGDLQHANVMVTPNGQLKLVDYDCMCVPALIGRPNLELGVEPYQHPQRDHSTLLFPGLDHFSELFILVVLRALAADPTLWFRYIEPPNDQPYDKLLIRKTDFDQPDASVLFAELFKSSDPDVGRLTRDLIRMAAAPIDTVPPLVSFVFNFDDVQACFSRREWDEGLELLDRSQSKKIPKPIQDAATLARTYVQARLELERSLAAGDERQIQAAYKPQLLDNYPRARPSVELAKVSPRVQPLLSQLEAARSGKKWQEFVATWDSNASLLAGRVSAEKYRNDVATWRGRNDRCTRLARLKSANPIDPVALADACQAFVAGGGHPDLDAEITEIKRNVERHLAFGRLKALPATADEQTDLALIAAWNESLFAGWNVAEKERPRISEASGRLANLAKLRTAIDTANARQSLDNEAAIKRAAEKIPAGYELEPSLRIRVTAAETCLTTVAKVEQLVTSKSPSEKEMVQCLKIIHDLKALPLVHASWRERLELAARRLPLLKQIVAINLQGTVDTVDRALIAIWNDELLGDCPDASRWKKRSGEAIARNKLLGLLSKALQDGDNKTVNTLSADPLLRGYVFAPQFGEQIQETLKKTEKLRALLDSLEHNRGSDFKRHFDHRIIKDNSEDFRSHHTRIEELMRRELLSVDKIGLSGPLVGRPIQSDGSSANRYRVKWEWPAVQIAEQCILGICQEMPKGWVTPEESAIHRIPLDRQRWQASGGAFSLVSKEEWSRKRAEYVVVWAAVDLGFTTVYSEPFVLGRLPSYRS